MTEFLRVRDNDTSHEYTIRAGQFNTDAHTQIDKPALDAHGDPSPVKHKTTVKKAAEKAGSAMKATDNKKES